MRALGDEGPIATVTAGWQEREGDDGELNAILDGRGRNLGLYRRWSDVLERRSGVRHRRARAARRADELQALYEVRLDHALRAIEAVQRSTGRRAVKSHADRRRDRRLTPAGRRGTCAGRRARERFDAGWAPASGRGIRRHRDEVAPSSASVPPIASSPAGTSACCCNACGCSRCRGRAALPPVDRLVGRSDGARDRVVLFHDFGPTGPTGPEVFAEGLGVTRTSSPCRMPAGGFGSTTPARMPSWPAGSPRHCLVLDDGVRVDLARRRAAAGARVCSPSRRPVVSSEGSSVTSTRPRTKLAINRLRENAARSTRK